MWALLIACREWDEERHAALIAEADAEVRSAQKEAEKLGILPEQGRENIASMFDDVFAELPPHLIEQRDQCLKEAGL